eukprot:6615491-Prymnesium_polylepis.1
MLMLDRTGRVHGSRTKTNGCSTFVQVVPFPCRWRSRMRPADPTGRGPDRGSRCPFPQQRGAL